MKHFKEKFIIGVDHGYGNIKTALTIAFKQALSQATPNPSSPRICLSIKISII